MEPTVQAPVEVPQSEETRSPKPKNIDFVLEEISRELTSVDALAAYISDFALQASVHVLRCGRLLEGLTDTRLDSLLTDRTILKEKDRERFMKVWDSIQKSQSYYNNPLESTILVSDDDIYTICSYLNSLLSRLRKEYSSSKGLAGWLLASPSVMLLMFIPVLFYSVGFIYTKELNPVSWFATGLESFSVQNVQQGWGTLLVNRSVSGQHLQIAGVRYKVGFGTHADSKIQILFTKKAQFLSGACGVDDNNKKDGSIECIIESNGKVLYKSGLLRGKMRAAKFRVPIEGLAGVDLIVTDGGDGRDYDHANWVDLKLE